MEANQRTPHFLFHFQGKWRFYTHTHTYVCMCAHVYIYMPLLHEFPVEIPGVGVKTYANEDAALLCISPLS